jgi:lipopolysaccharide export system protein LptC
MSSNSTGAPARPAAARGAPPPRRMPAPSRARRLPTSGQMARRRIMVAIAKRVLPLAGVGLLALIALWPEFDSAEERGRIAFRRITQAHPDAVRVVSPRYQGLDEQNRPYNLTADVATQLGNSQVVQLERPRADILTSDGAWVMLQSEDGHFDRARNHLDLAGQVTIHHDDGTQFVTDRASIELGPGTAEGDAPVAAQGPWGTLTAQGFWLAERGQVVVFTGKSRAVLEGRE